ncbi:MFS transporter [Streptomyces coelicoflavus]|uniref:MFS transporter n=1 Tax=Streptomyces salyersiae TaxID=3075530 RepID=A0ABU2REB5_9ACTN|nr:MULTISPECIES: MFS transporter [unclassified Streptomyces]MYS46228.1 MFS transporter [Streptomyces sp. SID5998]WDI21558.1 MFS transporter [Streptomyces enissocaesilis]AIV33306.1 MFS transporter [Streptomyces sp. CCM_MD2014]MCT7351772.1 MFS transporter [Streptomyces sp. 15-116A]MCW1097691.1 MFS transporter [Streptomyces sp. RS2]
MSDTETASTHTPQTPHPRRWPVLGLLGLAQLMLILDITVVAIALPHMGTELDLDRAALTWVVSGYALTFGSLMLLGGRAADLFGAKRVVLAGLTLFTAASLAAGLATGAPLLLAARIAQGAGAAMLSPAALSVVVRLFDGDERNKALGIWSALGGGGAALGVLLGGLITAGPGWAWVFFINVPVGLAVLAALARILPTLPKAAADSLDVPGAALVAAATGALIYALIRAGDHGWLDALTLALFAASAAACAAFTAWQRRTAAPLMDLRLLSRRPVLAGIFIIAVATALMVGVFFLGSFYLQNHQGHGALMTGVLFLPVALVTMAAATTAGRVIGRLGARLLATAALVLAAAGFLVPVLWSGTAAMVTGVSIAAAGLGTLFVVASATALGSVAPHEAGVASGIISTFHEFGASTGAAAVSSAAAASIATHTPSAAATGFDNAFLVATGIAAASALISLWLIPVQMA